MASTGDVAHCLNAGGMGRQDYETETMIAHSLRGEGFDASEDGTGRGIPLVPCISASDYSTGAYTETDVSDSLTTSEDRTRSAPIAIQERAVSENPDAGPDGKGWRDDGASYTLEARTQPQAVAFSAKDHGGDAMPEGPHDTANIRTASGGSSRSYVASDWRVRRLTPVECERLQGFPDNFTRIPWRGKDPDKCPDGPRYKALGNSMAVNVMTWIGERIAAVAGEESAK